MTNQARKPKWRYWKYVLVLNTGKRIKGGTITRSQYLGPNSTLTLNEPALLTIEEAMSLIRKWNIESLARKLPYHYCLILTPPKIDLEDASYK